MQKPNSALRGLSVVHLTMLIMQLLFAVIAIVVVANGIVKPQQQELDKILQVIAVGLAAAGFFLGTRRFKKMMQEVRESGNNAQQKFDKYRASSILLWAAIEGPSLFCIISFLITGNYAFIALAAVLIFLFFIFGPNRQKMSMFLGLSDYEIDNLK